LSTGAISVNDIVFDPFAGDRAIGDVLRSYGFNNIIERDLYTLPDNLNYFTEPSPPHDLLLINPPFAQKHEVHRKAIADGIPFAILSPLGMMATVSSGPLLIENGFSIIVPTPAIQFKNRHGKIAMVDTCGWFLGNFPFTNAEAGTGMGIIKLVNTRAVQEAAGEEEKGEEEGEEEVGEEEG
jgi:hypothetical protein